MAHRHSRVPDSLDVQQDCQTDVAPVCQTVSYVTRDKWDTIDDDSLAEAADVDGPNMDEFYQQVVSSDEEDCCDSDDREMSEEVDFIDSDKSDKEDCCDSDVWSVVSPFGMQWVHFRRKRLVSGRRLCSGTAYFQERSWPIRLFRCEGMCLCHQCNI